MNLPKLPLKIAAGLLVALVLLAGAVAFVLPVVIRHQAAQWVAEHTARTLRIEGLSINPLTWRIELRGVGLSEAGDAAEFAAFERLLLDVSSRSLFDRALILREVELVGPRLRLVREADSRFNFADLLELGGPPAPNKEQAGEPPRFSVNNIRLSGGSLDFVDRALAEPKSHRVRDLELSVPFIGNIPHLEEQYVTPTLSALVNGAPFLLEGELKPFAEAMEASVRIALDRLEAPYYLAYLPTELPFRVEFANISSDLRISYLASATEKPLLKVGGELALSVLTLPDATGERVFFLPLVMAKIDPSRVLERELSLSSLMLYDMEVWLSRDRNGAWSHSRLAGNSPEPPLVAEPEAPPVPPLQVRIEKARLFEGKFHFDDRLPPGGFRSEIEHIDLAVDKFSTAPGEAASFTLALRSRRGEKGSAEGALTLEPLNLRVALDLAAAPLRAYYPYLADTLSAPLEGLLGASAELSLSRPEGLRVADAALQVEGLSVPFVGDDGLTLKRVRLAGGTADLAARRFDVETVEVGAGELRLSRDAQGVFSPTVLLRPRPAAEPAPAKPPAEGAPFSLRIGSISAGSLAVAFTDRLPPLQPAYTLGGLDLALRGDQKGAPALSVDAKQGLRLAGFGVELRELAVPLAEGDRLRLGRLDVQGGTLDLGARRLEIGMVALADGELRFSRDAQGELSLLALLPPAGEKAPEPQAAETPAPFGYRVGAIDAKELAIHFRDAMQPKQPAFDMTGLSLALEGLSGPGPAASPFRLAARYGRGGSLKASGKVVPAPLDFRGRIELGRIPLTDFVAYLPEQLLVELTGGSLDARVDLGLRRQKDALRGDFGGQLGIRNFSCLDGVDRQKLLSWESLQLDGVKGQLAPFTLDIAEVALSNYQALVIIDEEGRLNLQQLYQQEPVSPTAGEPPERTPPTEPAPVRIDAITLQGGVLDFADNHLTPSFSTRMLNLGGRVSGLSSDPQSSAEVDLRGNLENQSPLTITGRINPLGRELFAELEVSFQNIELSPLTPYTATYLGYPVERGKLTLDLRYLIEQQRLDSSNHVFLDQFTLGDKVPSEQATGLPVKLAVALMKDRNGEIHLDLPVSGRTDDPEFSVFGVVMKLLKNLVVKAATAPFSLLASMLGGGQQDISTISFPLGSARLAPPEREKLTNLAEILDKRPALKLEVSGFADPQSDPEAYRKERLQNLLKSARYNELAAAGADLGGRTIEQMEVPAEQYEDYLEQVYRQADFPKPRNFFGMVKGLPAAEMEKLLLAHLPAGEEQMRALAWGRATVVRNYLIQEGKLSPERIFLQRQDVFKAPEEQGAGASRVEFGVVTP
ncbi:hypothetical protein DESUT3_35470 [Desulfuromonas versatilis]|uniref:AsmA domain-containing protein n=1 Tax=Desulfuromonas versatilis TaxID=2802975 RepID=A0ABM8HZE7_9BACT|nr:DUF748 domain-containing protein [Desulfuromonas versatilis]BCR06478.1 hypothetical protein DESUT3_35470 [Desulfuromonas versatilis]